MFLKSTCTDSNIKVSEDSEKRMIPVRHITLGHFENPACFFLSEATVDPKTLVNDFLLTSQGKHQKAHRKKHFLISTLQSTAWLIKNWRRYRDKDLRTPACCLLMPPKKRKFSGKWVIEKCWRMKSICSPDTISQQITGSHFK